MMPVNEMSREPSRAPAADTRYRILGPLGVGGMGAVFDATDSSDHHPVALKFLRGNKRLASKQLAHEAAVMALPGGPRICSVYDLTTHGGQTCLVMERLVGQTLEARLSAATLDTSEVLDIAVQLAEALEAIHRVGLVHQDIKPANIFVTAAGLVKVLDFGLATLLGESSGGAMAEHKKTRPSVMGTPNYVAPERLLHRPADFRSDLFSLGVVIYEMATGWPPFAADSAAQVLFKVLEANPVPIRALAPQRPLALERLVRKLLARDADKRYGSAVSVKKALLRVQRQLPRSIPRHAGARASLGRGMHGGYAH